MKTKAEYAAHRAANTQEIAETKLVEARKASLVSEFEAMLPAFMDAVGCDGEQFAVDPLTFTMPTSAQWESWVNAHEIHPVDMALAVTTATYGTTTVTISAYLSRHAKRAPKKICYAVTALSPKVVTERYGLFGRKTRTFTAENRRYVRF